MANLPNVSGSYLAASTERSGRNTPEYKKVKNNMENIVEALKATPSAKDKLSMKCKQNEWLSESVDPLEEDLVRLVLERIRQRASQFTLFISMLRQITGMDQIADTLELTGISFCVTCTLLWFIFYSQPLRSSILNLQLYSHPCNRGHNSLCLSQLYVQ